MTAQKDGETDSGLLYIILTLCIFTQTVMLEKAVL
jgi:hypothetical protein